MEHHASRSFRARYEKLSAAIRAVADKNYALLKENERHPSLQLKKVGRLWSVRVGLDYRAVGVDADDGILWIWIGSHAEYDKFIRS
jgi:mRNA-degrading endonuclease RelE of RelBE toxin-antitoxin system